MTTTPQPASALDRLFSSLHRSPVTRSKNRVIAGVCGGIAERTGLSPAIVRVGAVVLAILGLGVGLYLLAWLRCLRLTAGSGSSRRFGTATVPPSPCSSSPS